MVKTYDARGNFTEVKIFGVDGQPILGKDHIARGAVEYDSRGTH